MKSYALVALVAAAVTYLLTPAVRRFAVRGGAVAIPSDWKVHLEPTPEWGGLAIYGGLLASMGVARFLPKFHELFRSSSEPIAVLAAATIVVIVGVIDDRRDLRASTKLAGQLLAGGVLVLGGVQIFYFWLPGLGVISLSSDLSAIVTVLWTIGVINGINMIDGLDGLAVGLTTICAAAFFIYAYSTSDLPTTAALLTAIVTGAGLGFIRHNFHPARIFMGDTGSMLLGIILASATISGFGRTTEPKFVDVAGFFVPVLIPVLVLAIPIADAAWAVLRRVRGGRPVFHPDKEHIHHWVLEMAPSYRRAVLVMYLWSALLATATLVLALGRGPLWRYVSGAVGTVWLATVVLLPRAMGRTRLAEQSVVADAHATIVEFPRVGESGPTV
ncbi:MAG: MraY family glycosyltransferase [Actinomycetota bacterium]